MPAALGPLRPADAVPAPFTVLAAAAGVSVAIFSGWAATSAKDLAAVCWPATRAGPFTAAGVAAGVTAILGAKAGADGRCCFLASLHSLVLSTSLALFIPRFRPLPGRSRSAVATAVG